MFVFAGTLTLFGIRTSPGIECGAGVKVGIGVVVIWTFGSGFGEVDEDVDVDDDEAALEVIAVEGLLGMFDRRGLKAEIVVEIGRPAETNFFYIFLNFNLLE